MGREMLVDSGMEVQSMFLDYYQLREQPFGAASGPANVYASHTYCEALESLGQSLLGDRGHLALIAEPGMGKTTLLYHLLEGLRETGRATFLFQSRCNSNLILQFLLSDLGVDSAGMDLATMHNKLNEIWFAELLAGKRFVLMFDDAEDLDEAVLDTLRLLSKYETSNSKLLQIVLCGQSKLLQTIEQEGLSQLRKRIVEVKRLEPLSPMETAGYIRHRLNAAGHVGKSLFDPEAMAAVADLSHGIPQTINKICSRAMLEAYARGLYIISADLVEKAGRNLTTMPTADTTAITSPSTGITDPEPEEIVVTHTTHQLTYKWRTRSGLPRPGIMVGAVVGVLLSAGLVLPHGMRRGMTQIMRGESPKTSQVQRAEVLPLHSATAPALANAPAQPVTSLKVSLNLDATKRDGAEALPRTMPIQPAPLSLTRELGLKINRIVIDPGHGGFDIGAKGPHGLLEKDLCLDVALRLGQMIEENLPGAEVVYTRKDDRHVSLEERTAIANSADADLFISIHANSSDSSEVRGVETYYLSLATSKEAKELAIRENAFAQSSLHDLPDLLKKITSNEKSAESRVLAVEIQDTLSQRLQLVSQNEKNRGVKQAPFIVLTGAKMPAVLTEISFLSNASDETLLLEKGQRQRIADGLYRGIAAYLDGMHSLSQAKQKLVTENRANPPATFDRASPDPTRNPL
jgi:N-acetylmuramoyl-L-alanine amidase